MCLLLISNPKLSKYQTLNVDYVHHDKRSVFWSFNEIQAKVPVIGSHFTSKFFIFSVCFVSSTLPQTKPLDRFL